MNIVHKCQLAAVATVALIAGLVLMAGCVGVDRQDLWGDRLEGLFGVKFGESMPSNAVVMPRGDGTLCAVLTPKNPEFAFQKYHAMLNSETRVVIGFIGEDIFDDAEQVKCNEAYDRSKREIEARFKKTMKDLPPTMSGISNSANVLNVCGVMLPGEKGVLLLNVKTDGGNCILNLIALDMNAANETEAWHRQHVKSVRPLEGLFGRKLGDQIPLSKDEKLLANGLHYLAFEPEKKFLDFDIYGVYVLPKNRKTSQIAAEKSFAESLQASECFASACQLLEREFGVKAMDVTSNFDKTVPDRDGELVVKAAVMAFPDSSRFIEVCCVQVAGENGFRVRVVAYDAMLNPH